MARVLLRNPRREVELAGNRRVKEILRELDVLPESVLVIRGDAMMTADQVVGPDDLIELRPVMSGGSRPTHCPFEVDGGVAASVADVEGIAGGLGPSDPGGDP